ncbi:MAG: hypothetical protein H6716_28240, partial [Polyangiaceae bacterium]|nr:hypothetical protein [Polyangiaceae bacterium]
MAAVYDAVSDGTTSWTHTPTGTPRGVIVFVCHYYASSSVTVTYGGIPMNEVALYRSGSWLAAAFFLGSGIPTGAQTVAVTTPATYVKGVAVTVTADRDTVVADSDYGSKFSTTFSSDASAVILGAINAQGSSVLSGCAEL